MTKWEIGCLTAEQSLVIAKGYRKSEARWEVSQFLYGLTIAIHFGDEALSFLKYLFAQLLRKLSS